MRPIYVAIDTPELARALAIAEAVREHAGGLKLGLEFFAAQGPGGVRRVASLGLPLFLDLKLHDIPNTVAKAVQALVPLEPAILTVHAAGGAEMLRAAKASRKPGWWPSPSSPASIARISAASAWTRHQRARLTASQSLPATAESMASSVQARKSQAFEAHGETASSSFQASGPQTPISPTKSASSRRPGRSKTGRRCS